MTLEKFVKVKKKGKTVKYEKSLTLQQKAFRVVKDIDLMAIDDEGDVYPEVFRVGDIISGERFDEKFLEVLVERGVIEEVEE